MSRPEPGSRNNTPLVVSQIALRATHKGFPRSTGAIEGTIRRIKHVVSERAEYYRNGARLDKLVNLVSLDAIGLADQDIYASLITQHLIARGGAGLDWRSGRDEFGTVSIDVRIRRPSTSMLRSPWSAARASTTPESMLGPSRSTRGSPTEGCRRSAVRARTE